MRVPPMGHRQERCPIVFLRRCPGFPEVSGIWAARYVCRCHREGVDRLQGP